MWIIWQSTESWIRIKLFPNSGLEVWSHLTPSNTSRIKGEPMPHENPTATMLHRYNIKQFFVCVNKCAPGKFPNRWVWNRAFNTSVVTTQEASCAVVFDAKEVACSQGYGVRKYSEKDGGMLRELLGLNLARAMNGGKKKEGGRCETQRAFVFAYQLEITNNAAAHHPTQKVCVWVYKQHVSDWHLLFNSQLERRVR